MREKSQTELGILTDFTYFKTRNKMNFRTNKNSKDVMEADK